MNISIKILAIVVSPKSISLTSLKNILSPQIRLYHKKLKLHEKFGAEKFQKVVLTFDKWKFKLLNKKAIRKGYLKFADKRIQYQIDEALCKDLTDEQREELLDIEKRSKTLVRVELNEKRSINYHIGVNRRKEQFPSALEMNKKIHKDCLKRNGQLLGACIGLGILGIPILPQIVGGYQIIAAFKNMQCINIQEYNLARMKSAEKLIAKANRNEIQQLREKNQELISDISKAKTRGQNIDTLNRIVEGMTSKESLEQMRALILQQKQALGEINKKEYFFLCKYISGKFGTGKGPEFSGDPKYAHRGKYIPEIIKREDVEKITLLPYTIRDKFIEDIKRGRF